MGANNEIPYTQYLTWGLVVLGWFVTILVARFVLRKNARNSWIGELKKAVCELEDESIEFWMGDNEDSETIRLNKIKRRVKDITTLASEIRDYGGPSYPRDEMSRLRTAVTTEYYHDEVDYKLIRNLEPTNKRIINISLICGELTLLYMRK